jgi:hypothetical protein
MPYISKEQRTEIETWGAKPKDSGELNYILTKIIDEYIGNELRYQKINDVVGVLECAKLELYRRLAAPYEDKKRDENGEVYRQR